MNQIAVKCEGIKKSYGEHDNIIHALRGIDLELFFGELTLLVGPSGSGKTTLLSIIATILTPNEGQLFVLDREIHEMSDQEKAYFRGHNLGIIFQSLFLIPSLTVAENVALPLIVDGFSQRVAMEKAMDLLKKMHLDRRSDSSPFFLSKGQQQRVAIARAMANNAQIILCDEPTSSLDQRAGMEVMALLRDLALHGSKAILVVTHDHRIFPYASRIITMSDGKITNGEI